MMSKTHGSNYSKQTRKNQIWIYIILSIFSIIIISGAIKPASAYTAPYKLIVFTDKQVYLDFGYDLATGVRSDSSDNTKGSFNQRPNVFALLLDSDGNVVRGLTSANYSARLMDEERWNHSGAALNSYPFYQVIKTNGTYYPNASNPFPTFADSDNDGIYNSTLDVTDVNDLAGSKPPTTDQLNISINVTIKYQGVNYTKKVFVIFGTAGCYHPGNAVTSAHNKGNHDDTPCTTCHWSYQYALGSHGPNNSIMESDPARYTQIPAWNTVTNYDYKIGLRKTGGNQTTWDNSGSSYCVMCHGGLVNKDILDLGVGGSPTSPDQNADGKNDGGRPSCSWYQGPLGNNSAYPACHAPQQGVDGSSKIVQSSLNRTDWMGWSVRPGVNKSHNHSASPKTNGTPCEICHAGGGAPGTGTGGMHMIAGLPNKSTDNTNINDQCQICHNISDGWLNITANGGTAMDHSGKSQCNKCHTDNNKLDSHKIPVGAYGGKWCVDCHNLTGKSPIDTKIDETIINVSNPNYIHFELNKKANAANSSRICWACHTNNSYITNGVVNSTLIPVDKHPGGYDTPRTCTTCHNNSNTSQNFSAPQNKKHNWYSQDMKTPAVTYCVDCHGQDEEINAWNELISPPKTYNESSAHYGRNRTSFFSPIIGKREYCGYCHQNESTVFGPFANLNNKVRSDHASQITTPGCGDSLCHKPGRLHDDAIIVPNFTEANIDSTCRDPSCHSPANYSSHNNSITCWDCHLGNVSNDNPTWIHPIQFVQFNGNFTGAKLTAATCYDCHKSTRVDTTVQNLSGHTPKKVYGQAHSNDPINGTKWGDYWKYTPTTYEFAGYQIINGNGSINPAYPFENIKVPSNDYMELLENRTGSSNAPVLVPYNKNEREMSLVPVPNWTSSTQAAGVTSGVIISAEQDAKIGKPIGSLKASLKTGTTSGTYLGYVWWNYSFVHNPNTSQYAYTNVSADYNLTVPSGNTFSQIVYLRLVKPSGQVVNLASASSTTNTGWQSLINNSFVSALNESGSYKLQLYIELQGERQQTPRASQTYTVNYDNIVLKFQEKVWNRYEMVVNTTGVPVNGSSKLGMSYQVHMENTTLMIFNKTSSSYEFLDTLNSGVFYDYVKDISSTHHIDSKDGITGNVSVKFIDNDKSDTDAKSDAIHIRYLYVYVDRGLQYPCEQCHSPNKHYVNPTLGSPAKFSAGNQVNQTISSSSTWCQQCHWQGASNYSKMIQEFSVTRNPPENIPPEITGNSTFAPTGGARDGTPYLNHSGYDLSDLGCFGCHGGSLSPDEGMTAFIHDVSEGIPGGGRNCTSCHNIGGIKNNVNFSTIETSMHASLNNGAYSTPQNASNKPCWGCHGTFNGTFANESDQPESGHNTSVYKSPRKCDDCHIKGRVMFSAKNVTDHISSGYTLETDVNTSSYNPGYCSSCHNNSVNKGYEADGMGIFGGSPINASVSHYGTNKTSNMLMAPGYNSTDCVFCHRNNSNMLAWGILQDSLANISNKNASSGGTDHNQYISSTQCSACHGGYSITPGFTFHDGTLGNGSGASGGPDCTMCHDVNGAQKKVNFSAMNDSDSIHKNLNNEAFASDNTYNESKKCWACHGDGSQPQGHPTQYKTPSNCTDCHTNASSQFAGLQVSRHYWNSPDIRTPAANNCYICHNTREMMLGLTIDPDGAGSIYGGENGGNNSTSHYGKKRPDYQSIQDTNDYCTRCHNNASTVFPFGDNNNKTIANHSVNYPSTNPDCADCHSTGRIHNSTLTNPTFNLPNSTFCDACHGPSGSAAIKNKEKHNGSVDCTQCHLNSSRNIHPVQYLQQDTTSWNTSKTNAINCTDCHRSGFANATIIPDPSKHSNNLSNGSLWNNTAYWTTGSGSCYYCHNNTNHNSTALGTISNLLTDLNNTRKGQLATTTWCADCHYNDASNPNYKGDLWNPVPPLVTVNNTNKDYWINHSGYFDSGYKDSVCENCHSINASSSLDSSNYSHSLNEGTNGGPDCISCHDIGGSAGSGNLVNFSALGNSGSIHSSLNINATTSLPVENKKCWACHGDGSEPQSSGHPTNYKTPFNCDQCHVPGPGQNLNFNPTNTLSNVTQHYGNGTSIGTAAITSCYGCHNTSEMMLGTNLDPDGSGSIYGGENGGSNSTSHYGKKRPDYQSIQGTNDYCTRCHNNLSTVFPFIDTNNKTISNHSVNYPSTNPDCSDCHSTGRIHDSTLSNPKLSMPNSSYCETCHGLSGSAAIKNKEKHNGSVDCTQCHLNSSRSIHPVQYLKEDMTSWNTSKTNAVNCTNCHQSGFANAPIIPDPSKHSNNLSNGSLWNNTAYWTTGSGSCYYCHNNTNHNSSALGTISVLMTNQNNTRKGQLTTTTWCVDCHYNDVSNPYYKGDQWNPIPPLITVNNTNKVNWKNHTSYFGTGYSDIVCENCHVLNGIFTLDSGNYSHSLNEGTVGGPDCISCHSTAMGAGKQLNLTAMNDSETIHKNLNSNATNGGFSDENKKCWACHSNGSPPEFGHPINFRTPYKCDQCHVPGPGQNLNFNPTNTLSNVTQHYGNGTSIGTAAITSCYGCHNTSEMMLGTNLDPDGAGSIYGGENGGSNSTSHYGKKRPDYQSIQGTNDYCNRCHNNLSTVFPFIDTNNKTISNHSVNYPSTNPGCSDCHSTGRIHDNTLANPKFSLPNSSYCVSCHGPNGSASIKNKEKHNGSVDCTQCHLNSSRSIHPVQYLKEDMTSWNTSKTNAVNCTNCHQSGFANAPIIPDPSKHSNNLSNGSLWNNTAYWTTGSGSCYYCHNNTNHNSTALGTISILLTNQNNTRKGQLTTTTWCADCHYNDVSNPYYKGDQWNPIPPLITVNNTNNADWLNHSVYFGTGYKDSACESCHALNGTSSKDSMNYSHSLDAGTGGGPNCISCHGIGGSAPKIVNVTDIGKGIHNNLNGAAANANRSCYACHGDGNAPSSGHPVEYKNPKNCADCHSQGNYSAQVIQNHIPPKLANDPGRNISTNAYCTDCHNNSINNFAYTINGSVSHYGTNTTILKPTVNQTALPVFGLFNVTEAQDHNKECNNCHKNYPFNLTYGNATQIGFGHTSTGACDQCHLKGSASNLHNGSIIVPQTYSCLECHTSNASKYNASNITGTIMATYPTASCEINGCHGQGNANGLLDSIDKHNINVTFSGTAGNTGQVYLNGLNSITVTNGSQVLITSTINDISGGGYSASRVGGAEYYIDTPDPGVGKGIALYAEDGIYDAVDGAWENVNATIDTTKLSVGIHTVYVRGMDIGKQWSTVQSASLNIRSNIPYIPQIPDYLISTQGNFWINHTWQAGIGNITESFNVSVNGSWTNSTNINYSNNTVGPHGWSNISVWAFNSSGNGSLSLAAALNNTQVANNNPVLATIGNKTVAEGNLLAFTVLATDIDSDPLTNSTNATKGTFNETTGEFSWTPSYGDSGNYNWSFETNDNYWAVSNQNIVVTVINVPLSITSSIPITDPTSTENALQQFTINLNRTSNVTWYMNGSIVQTNTSVTSSNYVNSTAGIGVYNVTAIANDGFDTTSRKWNWTVTAISTYQVGGYVFDNYGIGTEFVTVQNGTHEAATSASGQYSITGLVNGTYNFSFSKAGFDTDYLELMINGADITNANITIFDTTSPGQVTGLLNDTPALTTINISWDPTAEANYYQVFRNTTSVGYTQNTYWNDTGLNSSTLYEFIVRANDTYNNWGQNSSILNVITATPDTSAPASISNPNMTTGNFFINNTWVNPNDTDLDHIWFRYSNGTTLQNVSKPANYLNLTYSVRYTQNISAQTVDTVGNINQTQIWFNTTIPNNAPVQSPIGNKNINENQLLQINVTATDIDSDVIKYGTNARNGTFNTSTGRFTWKPEFGEAGIYIWYFNSSDSYGGLANETITVTVNADPLGDCLSCHNSTQNGYPGINQPSFGKHMNVNTNQGKGILNNGDCITCHNDISNMFQAGYTTGTRTCPDCHTEGNFSAPIIRNHRQGGVNITTAAYCSTCHNSSINIFTYNLNSSSAHYSTNASLLKPTVNHTVEPVFGFMISQDASEYNRECSNCHNPSNSTYGNATQITLGHTSTSTCNQCHLNADADNLHNGSFIKPVTSDCKLCHTIYADMYKAPNLTTTDHSRGTYDCVTNNCHIQPDYPPKGKLNLSDHSVDFIFSPGNKPTTDLVSLNGSSSLTVYKGEIVALTSRIKDNPYTASRVRGAEYYIDSDPGSGKGTPMSANDGYFDASNGAWENIAGNIDTRNLTVGNHTVYVRGMDIGKQWSTLVTATLIVSESRGFVNGTVKNNTGEGIPGVTVITNTGVSVNTDNMGFYSLDMTSGTYTLTAIKEPEFYANNTFASVDITNSAMEIREAVLIEKPKGTISGLVRN